MLYNRKFKDQRADSVDLDEVPYHELPHQDLNCVQIQLGMSLALQVLSIGMLS